MSWSSTSHVCLLACSPTPAVPTGATPKPGLQSSHQHPHLARLWGTLPPQGTVKAARGATTAVGAAACPSRTSVRSLPVSARHHPLHAWLYTPSPVV